MRTFSYFSSFWHMFLDVQDPECPYLSGSDNENNVGGVHGKFPSHYVIWTVLFISLLI